MPALPGCHPPTKALAKGRLGSCGHLPLPRSMLRGSRWSTCWGEGGRQRCYLGKQCPPLPRQWPLRAAGQWGWVEGALIQDLASRGGSLAQRRLSGSDPSALTQAQWVEFRQQEKMSWLPSPLWGRCSSPLHDAQQQGGHRWAGRRRCHRPAGGSGCGGAAPVQSWRTPPRGSKGVGGWI